jgi:hypothetical protein
MKDPCGQQALSIVCEGTEVPMRPGHAEAEERVWLETYLADLMNNQRVLVYAYTSLERLVGQLENLLHDQPTG